MVANVRGAAMRLDIACAAIRGVPDRSARGDIDLADALVGVAAGELTRLGDPDRFQALHYPRSTYASGGHLLAFASASASARERAFDVCELALE